MRDATLDSSVHTPLVREWVKSNLSSNSWKDALVATVSVSITFCSGILYRSDSPLEFTAPRSTIYRAICDRLEMTDCIPDAIECFHQMSSELAWETVTNGEQAKWSVGEYLCTQFLTVIDLLQTSSNAALKSLNTSGIRQWMPNSMTMRSFSIQLH